MPSTGVRSRLASHPIVGPVLEAGAGVGRAAFGCTSIGCLPYAVAGVVAVFYAVAVVAGTLYERGIPRVADRVTGE